MDLSISKFQLPPLPCSFPLEIHPNQLSLSRELDEWAIRSLRARSSAARRKIVDSKISIAACMTIPHGCNDRKMVLAGKHLWTLFLLDDALEASENNEAAKILAMEVMEAATKHKNIQHLQINGVHGQCSLDLCNGVDQVEDSSPSPSVQALRLFREVVAEFPQAMPARTFDRYLCYLRHYLDSVIQEVRYQLAGHIPPEDEYRQLRRGTSFTNGTSGLFCELCMELDLADSVTTSKDFLEFVDLVADHISLTNDVLSFRKDFYSRVAHNWLFVLLRHSHRGRGFQSALDSVYQMIRETESRILEVQSRIERRAIESEDSDLLCFARCFPLCLAGNRRWSSITARYHGTMPTDAEFHGTWIMHPDATIYS